MRVRRAIDRFDMETWVETNFPNFKETNHSNIVRVCCPICGDYKPRMYIHLDKKLWWCHNCSSGKGKGAIDLIGFVEDKSTYQVIQDLLRICRPSYEEFKKTIQNLYEAPYEENSDLAELHLKPVELPKYTHRVYTKVTASPLIRNQVEKAHSRAKEYLKRRGVSGPLAYRYKIGVCYAGRHRNRLIIPAYMDGVQVSWVARKLDDEDSGQKYMNPLDVDQGSVLWNFDEARLHEEVVVCEGVFDGIRAGHNAVASFGKNVTDIQIALIEKYWKKVVLLLDPDAMEKSYTLAKKLTLPTRVVVLPQGKDAGSTDRKILQEKIKDAPSLGTLDDFQQKVLGLLW